MTTSPQDQAAIDQVGDRLETLTDEQRQRILWRISHRFPQLVDRIIDEFERSSWEYGR